MLLTLAAACSAPRRGEEGGVLVRVAYIGETQPPAQLSALLWSAASKQDVPVHGTAGVLRVPVAHEGHHRLEGFVVDGVACPDLREAFDAPGPPEIRLVVERAREVTLVVTRSGDGTPVAGALVSELKRPEWGYGDDAVYPLAAPTGITDMHGRLRLGPARGQSEYSVRAPGLAWQPVIVTFGLGGEVRAELSLGSALRLTVDQWSRMHDASLWLVGGTEHGWVLLPRPDANGEVSLDHLRRGRYEVLAIRGRPHAEERHVYARGAVELVSGETATLRLAPEESLPERPPALIVVTGTVTLPPAWRERSGIVGFYGREEATARAKAHADWGGGFSGESSGFRSAPIPEGRYFVSLYPVPWGVEFTLKGGNPRCDIAVPEPVDLSVRVVQARGGGDLPGAALAVSSQIGRERVDPWSGDWGWNPHARRFQVPPGSTIIRATADGYVNRDVEVDVRAGGERDVLIEMEPAGILEVRLRVEGRQIAGVGVEIELGSPWTVKLGGGFEKGVWRRANLEAGEWTVYVRHAPGMKVPPPRTVRMRAGEVTQVTFDLERAP